MIRYAWRILAGQPLRLALTVAGVALCVVLMLFLLGAYRGVADGSVEYIRRNRTDLWVLQRNAWNILRQTSLLSTEEGKGLRDIPGVRSVTGVLFLLSTVKKEERMATVYLTGFDAGTGVGGPPRLVEGRTVRDDGEIVLDKSFAAKFGFRPGDLLRIQDTDLAVVGISSGTNAFVIQYAFVTLARAQSFLGLPDTVTCFMVKLEPGAGPGWVTGEIRRLFPGSEVYDHQTFLENNIREMETGFLPFLYTIAFLGVVVLTAILSLILTVNILEKRRDFAVLKTLGSPGSYLAGLVAGQALLICASGIVWGTAFFFPLTAGVERIVPEVAARTSPWQMALIASAALAIGLVSSTVSLQRLRRIYALEAFA